MYDLAEAWLAFTGMPFLFAAWVATTSLPGSFLSAFNEANAAGLTLLPQIAARYAISCYDLATYYTENISYNHYP